MTNPISLHAHIHGRVQGVFFRAYVQDKARQLGLTGFARNLPSGEDVEVQAEGERLNLERLINYLKIGPPSARVESVSVTWSKYSGRFNRFEIRS
jgi:Acylphosphatases